MQFLKFEFNNIYEAKLRLSLVMLWAYGMIRQLSTIDIKL